MSGNGKIVNKPPMKTFQMRKTVAKTTAEQEQELRDQLHFEIENKTKACSNVSYDCSLPRVEGHEYCIRHILQDAKAPYKQCAFVYSINGKRCLQPAPKFDPKRDVGFTNYCFEHSRLAQVTKTRVSIGKLRQIESSEILLNSLAHHVKQERSSKASASSSAAHKSFGDPDDCDVENITASIDPFLEINSRAINDSGRAILDYASDSSSDEESATMLNTWRGHDMDVSETESIDSQNEDYLKHAGIYTTEEVTMVTKDKLVRLQRLYIDQFYRLQHVLKERRRKYLHALRRERESLCSIFNQPKDTLRERRLYDKLKALNQYHRRNGVEAILYKKFLEKRAKNAEGAAVVKPPFHAKCSFSEGGVKCVERTMPSCKYCRKHILEDKKQVLFRPCGVEKSGVRCSEAVPNIFDDATCVLHIEMPVAKQYTQKKYESESDEDDGGGSSVAQDNAGGTASHTININETHHEQHHHHTADEDEIELMNITVGRDYMTMNSGEYIQLDSHEEVVITEELGADIELGIDGSTSNYIVEQTDDNVNEIEV